MIDPFEASTLAPVKRYRSQPAPGRLFSRPFFARPQREISELSRKKVSFLSFFEVGGMPNREKGVLRAADKNETPFLSRLCTFPTLLLYRLNRFNLHKPHAAHIGNVQKSTRRRNESANVEMHFPHASRSRNEIPPPREKSFGIVIE